MGSFVSTARGAADKFHYLVHVRTGNRKGASTDQNVWIVLIDESGKRSPQHQLNHLLSVDHEQGMTSTFQIPKPEGFGKLKKIIIWKEGFGLEQRWFVDKIVITEHHTRGGSQNDEYIFPILRWIRSGRIYFFYLYDVSLPQYDPHAEQRQKELQEKRIEYQFFIKIWPPIGPPQIASLPDDEKFSMDYLVSHRGYSSSSFATQTACWQLDFSRERATLIAKCKFIGWTTDKWNNLEQFSEVYKLSLGRPKSIDYWQDDRWFGLERLQGVHPTCLRLCTSIPTKFDVVPGAVEPFLEGKTLEEALGRKKLFLVDHSCLQGIDNKTDRPPGIRNTVLCSPMALFYLNDTGDLLPVAIQLFQDPSPENPVFLPSDPYYTWQLAKMWFNNCDAQVHQTVTHLGYTHLVMEGIVISAHRQLSVSHPLFKLLAPHFLFLMAINSRGLEKLVCAGGWADTCTTIGAKGMGQLIAEQLHHNWRMDVHGHLPKEIESRGLLDSEVLPYYPYRDDGLPLYEAIQKYVTQIVCHYYDDPQKISEDYELQNWRNELVAPKHAGGIGLRGVPGEERQAFTTVEEVADLVTCIITTCSFVHAANNFGQYDAYGFLPNYPGVLMHEPPKDKRERTVADILDALPNKQITLNTLVITKLLSYSGTLPLGYFELPYMYDPPALECLRLFRKALVELSQRVRTLNKTRRVPYKLMDPALVPNAISI